MRKLLRYMRRNEWIMAAVCALLILGQIYFDLSLPDYMSSLTVLIKTPGTTMDEILRTGLEMLGCTLASAALCVLCGYLTAKVAAGFSYSIREAVFNKIADFGQQEMMAFSVPSLINRTTNDITQVQTLTSMGLQILIKAPIMAVWAIIKIVNKSWTLSAITAGFVLALLAMMALIIGPISIAFVATGIYSYSRSNEGDKALAEVGGSKITPEEFDQTKRQELQQLQQQMGSNFKSSILDNQQARAALLDRLLTEHALAAEVAKEGILVSREQAINVIKTASGFQVNGKFDPELYKRYLASQGKTDEGFVQELQQDLARQMLLNNIVRTTIVSKSSVNQLNQLLAGLEKYQNRENGLWRQVVDRTDDVDNWCDTSGSAMFLYTWKWAADKGIVPVATEGAVLRKGYEGLLARIVPGEDGLPDVHTACQGLCVQKCYEDYIHYPKTVNAQEAVCGCLWALAAAIG